MGYLGLLRIMARCLSSEASMALERLLRSATDADYVIGDKVAYFIIVYGRSKECKPVMISRDSTMVELDYLAIATRRSPSRGIQVSECRQGEIRRYTVQQGAWKWCKKPSYTGTAYTRDFRMCLSQEASPVRHWRG